MPEDVEISVIVPTRDALRWLPAALTSIGHSPRVEILVVNDGSTDGTDDFLVGRMASDLRVRTLIGPQRGPSAARNLAIRESQGALIAFLDADDRWLPGKLDQQVAVHRGDTSVGMSFTDYQHVTEDGDHLGSSFGYWQMFRSRHGAATSPFKMGDAAMSELYAENVVGTSTVMMRRELLMSLGGFDESLSQAEDWDLWLRAAAEAPVTCLPMVMAEYLMRRPGNLSGQASVRASALRIVADRYRPQVAKMDPSAVRTCSSRLFAASAEAAHAEGRTASAALLRFRAFVIKPSIRAARETAAAVVEPIRARQRAALS